MTKKWVLTSTSTGQRGQIGKKKVYEVTVNGLQVLCVWGMAEKTGRQSRLFKCMSPASALYIAETKVMEKQEKGYKLAYIA